MSEVRNVTWSEMAQHVECLAEGMVTVIKDKSHGLSYPNKMYPIPRGGVYVALALLPVMARHGLFLEIVEDPKDCDFYVDDIIDSGKTVDRIYERHGVKDFFSLIDKTANGACKSWYSFPWERMSHEQGPEANVVRLLEYIGEDPKRDGLIDTPKRVVKAYGEMFSGYRTDIKSLFTTFDAESYDEMILLRDVPFTSWCEHHMLPFTGTVTVGYIPSNGRIVGVSKLARVVDAYARRLQVQERLTSQIASTIDDNLQPLGVACVVKATHLCMSCRGIRKEGATMVTSKLLGVFKDPAPRAEFLHLA